MRNKKLLLLTVAVILALVAAFAVACTGGDGATGFVSKGSFETVEDNGWPTDWEYEPETFEDAAKTGGMGKVVQDLGGPESSSYKRFHDTLGDNQYKIENPSGTYTYTMLYQKVKLQQGKVYKLSAYIRVDGSNIKASSSSAPPTGLRVGFLEDDEFTKINVYTASATYEEYVAYFIPGTSRALTLFVSLGEKNGTKVTGTAFVDNVSITLADEAIVPANEISTIKYNDTYNYNDAGSIAFTVVLTLLTIALCVLAYVLVRKNFSKPGSDGDKTPPQNKTNKNSPLNIGGGTAQAVGGQKTKISVKPLLVLAGVILGAFLVRILFVFLVQSGYGASLGVLREAATTLVNANPTNFFASAPSEASSNLAYGNLYVFWALGGFANLADIAYTSLGMNILVRLPMIIADIVTAYMIFNFSSKYYGYKVGGIFAGLFAILPFVFTSSSVFAMTAMISLPFMIGAFLSALNKKYIATTALYTLAVMFNYYLVFLAPIFVAYHIYYFIREDKTSRIKIGVGNLCALVLFFLLSLPFTVNMASSGSIFYIAVQMWEYFGQSAVLSDNVFNFYTMIGLPNQAMTQAMAILQVLFTIILIGIAVYLYVVSRNRLNILLTTAFLFIFLAMIGTMATFELLALGLISLFVYAIISGERRIFKIFTIFAATFFMNVAMLGGQSGYISGSPKADGTIDFASVDPLNIIISIINLLATAYFTYVTVRITFYGEEKEISPLLGNWFKEVADGAKEKWTRFRLAFSRKGK